jgi:S-DNA-T family DNA segregation ATPase FtsK/SpoIIIE
MIDLRRIRDDLFALGLFAATVFVALALFSYNPADPPGTAEYPALSETTNLCGSVGAELAHHLFTSLGYGAYFVLVSMISSDGRLFSKIGMEGLWTRSFGLLIALVAVCIGLHVLLPAFGDGPVVGTGGYVGAWGQILLAQEFATVGSLILLGSLFAAGLVLSGDVGVVGSLIAAIVRFVTSPWRFLKRMFSARPRWKTHRPAPPDHEPDDPKRQDDLKETHGAEAPDSPKDLEDNSEDDGDENEVPISIPINAPPRLSAGDGKPSATRLHKLPRKVAKTDLDLESEPVSSEMSLRNDQGADAPRSPASGKRATPKPRILQAKLDAERESEPFEETHGTDAPITPESEPRAIKVNPPLSVRETVPQADEAEHGLDQPASDVLLPPLEILEPAEEFPYEILAKKAQADAQT